MILEVSDNFTCGLNFKESSTRESITDISNYDLIQINIPDGRFYLDFAYRPNLMTNNIIENWIIKWRKYIERLPLEIGYSPDEKFRISYNLSLFDQINFLIDKF